MQRIARFPILMSTLLLNIVLVSAVPGLAANREADRVKESGTVLKEILGMPDNIPTDLLKKSAVRAGAAIGEEIGDWGGRELWPRRDDVPRRREVFREGGRSSDVCARRREYWISVGRAGYGFSNSRDHDRGVDSLLSSKVKLGADVAAAAVRWDGTRQRRPT